VKVPRDVDLPQGGKYDVNFLDQVKTVKTEFVFSYVPRRCKCWCPAVLCVAVNKTFLRFLDDQKRSISSATKLFTRGSCLVNVIRFEGAILMFDVAR
jgi:hypothetical protein